MTIESTDLQQMPPIASNAETMLAAARAFSDWLNDLKTNEHPTRVLTVMIEALIHQLEKEQQPAPLEGSWIVERLGKTTDGERSASSHMNWAQVDAFMHARRESLIQTPASQQIGFFLFPTKASKGKRGVTSTYGWRLEIMQVDADVTPATLSSDSVTYTLHLDVKPSWAAQPFFPKGVMHFRSWRGIIVLSTIVLGIVSALLLTWGVWLVVIYGKLSAADLLIMLLVLSAVLFTGWRLLIWPATVLIDDRIAIAPSRLTALSSDINSQWELFRQDKDRWIQLVRYTAPCPACGATLHLSKGEPDWPRRLVGRCAESPREHVYSFDRVTRRGVALRKY